MIVHYNIKSDPKYWHGMRHIAIFYLGDCEAMDLMKAADLIKASVDDSIGLYFI